MHKNALHLKRIFYWGRSRSLRFRLSLQELLRSRGRSRSGALLRRVDVILIQHLGLENSLQTADIGIHIRPAMQLREFGLGVLQFVIRHLRGVRRGHMGNHITDTVNRCANISRKLRGRDTEFSGNEFRRLPHRLLTGNPGGGRKASIIRLRAERGKLLLALSLGGCHSGVRLQLRDDLSLHLIKRDLAAAVCSTHGQTRERSLHFDRLGITLLVHAVIREQKLNHVLIQILSVRRVAKTGLRDVFNDHGLQVVPS